MRDPLSSYQVEEALTLNEEWQECNHEYQEDTNDAALDPLEDGGEVVAAWDGDPARWANLDRRVESTKEYH